MEPEDTMVSLKMCILTTYIEHPSDLSFAESYNGGYINALWERDLVTQDEYNRLILFNGAIRKGLDK